MIIPAVNNLTINAPKTYLSVAGSAGTSVFTFKNLNGFQSNWAIQLGETGEAQSEILLLSSGAVSGTLGTSTANTVYDHPADTPVYAIKYDKIVFERSTTGTSGIAAPITNGTIGIQPNLQTTTFDDTTGLSTYAYKTYFYNSVIPSSSTESDWITSSGFSFYSLGKIRQRVLDKLASTNITDPSIVNDWINEWGEVMNNTAIDVDEGYAMGTFSISYAAGVELGTITQADFKQLRRAWWADASGTYVATKMESNTFSPNKTFSVTYPYFYFEGDNVIGRKPGNESASSAGSMIFEYYKLYTPMVEDTDTLPVNMQAYSKTFVDYAHAQALLKDQKADQAQPKLAEAMNGLALFKKEITPRNKTGPTYQEIVEDTAADQELWL